MHQLGGAPGGQYPQYAIGPNGEYMEEPQTPTQNYGQMSFEDAIDGSGNNSGSYNAGQQQRRIIREIIV